MGLFKLFRRKGDLASFNNTVNQQRAINEMVHQTKCPVVGCGGHLTVIGYENSHDMRHQEIAIVCNVCKSEFLWTKEGLKVGYKHES